MPEFVMGGRDHATRQESSFVYGFIEALFFTETSHFTSDVWHDEATQAAIEEGSSDGNIPADCGYTDLDAASLAAIRKFCEAWQAKHSALLDEAYATGYDESQAGRDFFYEHVGHGVGFSDRAELTASSDEELKAELQAEMRASGTTPQRWNELFAQVKAMESDIAERLSDAAGRGEVNPYYGEDSKIHVDLY